MIEIKSIGGFSKKGKRDNNEDYILFKEIGSYENRVIVLCDGMGGHGHGEVASQTVADCVFEFLKCLKKEQFEAQDLQDALDAALTTLTSVDIYDDKKSMGTTLVVVAINRMNILVGHVGDSRCYLFDENGLIKFRTKDHSKVAEAIEAEILTPEEAFVNPHKNLLTRCVMSGKNHVMIDVNELKIEDNYRMLLCSDGVTDAIRDKEIEECLIDRDVQGALEIIDSICNEKSKDNYSAILLDFSQSEENHTIIDEKKVSKDTKQENEANCCLACGETNDSSARFCRKCGTELREKDAPPRINIKNRSKGIIMVQLLKKAFPLLFVLIGALLMVGYYKVTNYIEGEKIISEIASQQAKDIYRKQLFDIFIFDLCSSDSTGLKNDSVLRKDTIMSLYNKFCNEQFSK